MISSNETGVALLVSGVAGEFSLVLCEAAAGGNPGKGVNVATRGTAIEAEEVGVRFELTPAVGVANSRFTQPIKRISIVTSDGLSLRTEDMGRWVVLIIARS